MTCRTRFRAAITPCAGIKEAQPDLVLMDINLKGKLDGRM